MRELTEADRILLGRRRKGLDAFLEQGYEVLVEFMELLELPEPHMVLRDAERYLVPVDSWVKDQVVTAENRNWILTRFLYFIGELLLQRLRGHWFVEEVPDSPYFSEYVVGLFARLSNPYARISPAALSAYFVDLPPGRSLIEVIDRAEAELRECKQSGTKGPPES